MAKTYGNFVSIGGGGGQKADLPPLLDNFKAFKGGGTSENPHITIQADKMATSRANELAGAVWVYGDHEPTSVNDGTKIQLTREEVVTSDGGEAQTVTKTVEWNNEANFFARQFTYNSKKQYQTMIEGATANVVYSEFPEEPTSYSEITQLEQSDDWEATEDGWFQIDAVSGSGDGGSSSDGRYIPRSGGGSGGSGAIARKSKIKLNKGEKVNIEIANKKVTIQKFGIIVNPGENGGTGTSSSPGTGGNPGTASGGDININGRNGSRGVKNSQQQGNALGGNSVSTPNDFQYTITSGNGGTSYHNSVSKPGGRGSKAFVKIFRGNTNTPAPSQASVLSLIPKNNSVEATWENSGDPVQTGTMLVYNTSHVPKSPSDGVAVDIPLTQPVTLALNSDSEELQEDSKKQSYTIKGVPNDKPVFVALFPYDKNRKYGLAKQEIEIPREHSWYDKQQELESEVETVKAEMADYQSYYTTTQEVLK